MTSVTGVAVSPPVAPRREDVAEVRDVQPKVEEAPKAPEAPKPAPKRAEAPPPAEAPEAEGWRDAERAPEPPRAEVRAYWDTIEQTQPGRPGSTFRENF